MPEPYQWQSALATLGIEARALAPEADVGVVLSERRAGTQLAIRADASHSDLGNAMADVLGVELPIEPKKANRARGTTLLWLGPDEWLAAVEVENDGALMSRLGDALSDVHHAVVDVTHSRTIIGLEGANARDVLMKGTNIDVHPRVFGPDSCIQAHLGRCHMLLHQLDDGPSYDIYIHRSFAMYAWSWLCDAAGEYGVAVRSTRT